MDVTLIVAIVGVIGSLISTYLALKKQPFTNSESDAQASKAFMETAMKAREDIEEFRKQTDARITVLENRIAVLEEENELLKDWAERLVAQVKSLGHEPVKMKSKQLV